MPIILRRIFSASLGCSQLVQHSDVPDHVVTLYELDSGKPGGSGGGKHKLAFQRPKLTRRREPPIEREMKESTVSFLLEDVGDYRPRPLMQIGHQWNRPFESLQREGCASVIDRIGECHADELPPDDSPPQSDARM
jgi:hypothetical protein